MQTHAAWGDKWHLYVPTSRRSQPLTGPIIRYAIFQHTVNAGAVPWETTIHALVVEAIRRNEFGGFDDKHEFLGKALNGLLPRRARLADLGNGGWNDLAWLLELNQGFYNAASLAAVCSLAEDTSVSWLGKPIDPTAGNERLEPIVTAFPVSPSRNEPSAPLTIIGGETLGFRPNPLSRDRYGLYTNEEMKGLKTLALCIAGVSIVVVVALLVNGHLAAAFILLYITAIAFACVELLASTMYLDRAGWGFLEDEEWGNDLEAKLIKHDSHLGKLTQWGDQQLVPQWEVPRRRPHFSGKLVDLRSRVYVNVVVVSPPNALVPLAIHGSGVTCMLLERPANSEKEPTSSARKVGMCNVPPYIFSQTEKSGSIRIGTSLEIGDTGGEITPHWDIRLPRSGRPGGTAGTSSWKQVFATFVRGLILRAANHQSNS
ncbi:hypothetical protein DFH07DRAFT_921503 [Mycena maculata]|uniref:Uncharacterized protein n=1 Tax=Mycena maculata TaxID=230809 RepID=A0AAD7NAW3_9AGAR|nr:hypothetical protein DFH07DRAFT_921503 [Mycena maculata]